MPRHSILASLAALTAFLTIPATASAEPPASSTEPAVQSQPGETPDAAASRRTLGFIGLGASAVLFGGGYYAGTRISAINNDGGYDMYRRNTPAGDDVCKNADAGVVGPDGAASPGEVSDMCTRASRWKTAEYAMYGTGVVALVAGIVALAWPDDDAPAAASRADVRVEPVVSQTGGAVQVQLLF